MAKKQKKSRYDDHADVLSMLEDDIDADLDNRERVREIELFLHKADGQWEQKVSNQYSGRPKYTFDRCNPVVDGIAGQIEQSEFAIEVSMASGDSTKEVANTYDGMIRNSDNLSNEQAVKNFAARRVVETGISGWEIVHDYVDGSSPEPDLLTKALHNFTDRVYFDSGAFEPTMADANHVFVLSAISKDAFDDEFPGYDGNGVSVNDGRSDIAYWNKPDTVVIGRILYKKMKKRTLLVMSNGAVYDAEEEELQDVLDEFAAAGIKPIEKIERDVPVVYQRYFDNEDWLNEEEETVFEDYLPVVPVFANFTVIENKVIYWGAIEKLLDQQRILNYAYSRMVEFQILSAREKMWMTKQQAAGHTDSLESMNINSDPVQFYNHISDTPQPYKVPGPQVDQSLTNIAIFAAESLDSASSFFKSGRGEMVSADQSGVAIEKLQDRTDNASYKFFSAIQLAKQHSAKIMVKAIPKVYTGRRQVRILGEDGTVEIQTINDQIIDQQTGRVVELNNLSRGKYDVVCSINEAFKNRQEKTVKHMIELGKVDPRIIQMGADVLLQNIQTPGMDIVAKRLRRMMLQQGIIPDDQMTEEEKVEMQQLMQQQQQNQGADVNQALIAQAQAELQKAQATQADTLSKIEERSGKLQLQFMKMEQEGQQKQQNFAIQVQKMQKDSEFRFAQLAQQNQGIMESIAKTQAETLNLLRSAIGADAIMAPEAALAYRKTAAEMLKQ